MFCKHDWAVLSETVTESRWEHLLRIAGSLSTANLPESVFDTDRKHIQVFTCNKCGKLKRFVENI